MLPLLADKSPNNNMNNNNMNNNMNNNRGRRNRMSSSSSSSSRITFKTVCSRVLISAVLLRFGVHLFWMHTQILPDYLTPAPSARILNLPSPLQFRQSLLQQQQVQQQQVQQHANNISVSTIISSIISTPSNGNGNQQHQQQQQQKSRESALERRERTRPPLLQQGLATDSLQLQLDASHLFHSSTTLPLASQMTIPNDIQWLDLCTRAGLNETSRVVITGLLTEPPAMALALVMAKQCRVQRITGVDALFPNLRAQRMHDMNSYRVLMANIPNLQLIVPVLGVGKALDDLDWLRRLEPTHVIHMETTTDNNNMDHDVHAHASVMADDSHRLYQLQHGRMALEQLLQEQQQQHHRFQLLHVATAPDHNSTTTTTNFTTASRNVMYPVLAGVYHALFGTSWTQLQLPQVYGPFVTTTAPRDNAATAPLIYVDNAVAAILTALQPQQQQHSTGGVHSIQVEPDRTRTRPWLAQNMNMLQAVNDKQHEQQQQPEQQQEKHQQFDFRVVQSLAYKTNQERPHGIGPITNRFSFPKVSAKYVDTYLTNPSRLPCSSSCASSTSTCRPSAWDDVIPYSRKATQGCQFVAYSANFSSSLDSLSSPRSVSDELCRVAFVSGKSPLVQNTLLKRHVNLTSVPPAMLLQTNGKITVDGWTLVWLPNDDDESLSDADNGLPLIDPSRLFADSVNKAMFLGALEFEKTSDTMLLRVFLHMDRAALPAHSIKEMRSGTAVSRWVPRPPERARRAILFGGEPPADEIPRSPTEFVELLDAQEHIPAKQLVFYQQAAHLVQTNDLRPEFEVRQTVYPSFPFQWTRLSLLVHDFTMEASRQLRCDWYDEYLFWGSNRNMEELSLAYVIGKRRIEGSMGPNLQDTDDTSWAPLLKNSVDGMEPQRDVNGRGAEIFIRIMERRASN
jgi:hypothetical protein